jgi:hypothetical protein
MKLKLIAVSVALALGAATGAQAQTRSEANNPRTNSPLADQAASDSARDTMRGSRDARKAEEERIEAQAKAERQKCDPMKGNAKDICQAEAKGKEKVAKAELDAKHAKDRVKAQQKVTEAKAEAKYEVDKQRCDDQKGEAKDACMKQARVERDKLKGKAEKTADAKRNTQRPAAAGGSAVPRNEPTKSD